MLTKTRTFMLLIAFVATIAPFIMSRSAFAQDTATLTVSAQITSGLSLTTCDATVEFGSGLTAFGSAPFGSNEVVTTSQPGEPSLGEGVIYVWRPVCDGSGYLFRVNSTQPYILSVCATEDSGTAGPVVGNRVLEWYFGYELDNSPTYKMANGGYPFNTDCQSTNYGITDGPVADYPLAIRYLLRVDQAQPVGTINVTTVWTLSL